MTPENIIETFQKEPIGKKMAVALVGALVRFRDAKWAFAFMQYSQVFYIDILELLPDKYQEVYSNKFFDRFPDDIIEYVSARDTEWGEGLAINIVRHCAKNPYQYNRTFYEKHILRFPVFIGKEIERLTPPEAHMANAWSSIQEYAARLFSLKSQIIKAFNK